MKKIKLMVFDMAGTTVNEDNIVYKTLASAINNNGYKVDLEKVLDIGAGKDKMQAIKDITSSLDQKGADTSLIYDEFKRELETVYNHLEVKSFTGVESLIKKLRDQGVKIVLNTGYKKNVANYLLKKLNWEPGIQYDMLITSDDVPNGRPAPDMIFLAMEKFGIKNPSEVLKAGDSVTDIEEGKNANCGLTVAVLTGAQTEEQLKIASPDYIISSLGKLQEIL